MEDFAKNENQGKEIKKYCKEIIIILTEKIGKNSNPINKFY